MDDRGLREAIQAAGGVTELARRIGVSQPSISNWTHVPADRVLSVEAATGVAREALRPDLFGEQAGTIDATDTARAQEYALLAVLLARPPETALLKRLARLRGDETPLGHAHSALAQAASRVNAKAVEREYFNLFIGVGRGEILPYGSYYLTGFLNERPLMRLREDLRRLGIERAQGQSEPEDHAAILCDIMAGLIEARLSAPLDAQETILERHLSPWIGQMFADLEQAGAADFYRHVGTVGRVFLEVEVEALALPA